ncbi:MAG: 1,4-dihydroxy-2-naphthoate octaprenyltransferase [Petrimonas sp.]|jgi:1,4-dihydroxy-2-naphthoate octaprenyltransferase|uniref:1,4-dihydroxy-2-naphthoate octaprenyltransferase n=1 Tax=Petrimonas TaxID=307628 RepID=UPI000E916B7F|nr:1,4-dihydroxy-2-naphthoate octaprenyltransferase [Petrimonas sp.]HAC72332.1 1,4-dihydroxy-2-naphthoate octaprenyltransferase [Porphyromonadaceae bacterium]MDD2911013.1 1,4-dihydroxy-2-naphthoate octaprenyltransferase [Petrimonas sp.]MDD3541422.1 1,4-dihydroxy-2-naphthoate octaprenyltransferase [Petrimonas sp.]MDD4014758.1 1,4-dihydroxy-2-naphthoate octaprenyltransferase [Petrimonas sp.]
MPKLKHWLMVAHPWSWPASGSPAMIAFSYVFYMYKTGVVAEVNWLFGMLAIIGAVIFHAAGNLISEYHDYVRGVDKLEKTGPVRLIVLGIFEPKPVLLYGYLVLSAGILLGIYLLVNTGFPLLIIGTIGIISSTLYYKFKYAGMSDLVIFICYGLSITLGVVYVMTTELYWPILLISTPVGMLIVAILHANNTRDMLQDKEAGIKTQAMKLGLEGSQIVYQTLLLVAYLIVAIAVMMRFLHPVVFVVLVTFPLAIKNIKLMKTATVDNLVKIQFLDTHTAKLVLMFSVLLSAANFIAPFV